MTYAEMVLPEFDQEMASTRKVLERVPDDKLGWQPHPKSHTIGWNANHIANLPEWLVYTMTRSELDIAPVGGEPYKTSNLTSRTEILETFDQNVSAAKRSKRLQTRKWRAGGRWLEPGSRSSRCPAHRLCVRSFSTTSSITGPFCASTCD